MSEWVSPEEQSGKTRGSYRATKQDAERANAKSDVVFDAMGYPQRKLKEAISGDELGWVSPESMPKGPTE